MSCNPSYLSSLQAKRVLLLDGVMNILEGFTDYEQLALSSLTLNDRESTSGIRDNRSPCEQGQSPTSLPIIMNVLSAIPADLVSHRYLPKLAAWVAGLPFQLGDTLVVQHGEDHTIWLSEYKRRMEAYLSRRSRHRASLSIEGGSEILTGGVTEGQSLCLLGLMLSEAFALQDDRDQVQLFFFACELLLGIIYISNETYSGMRVAACQVLADGLAPMVRVLQQCWHEPYVAAETVRAALILFSGWAAVCDVKEETGRWRWRPLECCVNEVVTLVTARLVSLIKAAANTRYPGCDGEVIGGGDAQVLLSALSAAMDCAISPSRESAKSLTSLAILFHPGVISLRDQCVSLLTKCEKSPLPPTVHTLAIASLEIVVRAQEYLPKKATCTGTGICVGDEPECIGEKFCLSNPEKVVFSLLQHKVEGRIVSQNGSIGEGERLKPHAKNVTNSLRVS